MDKLSNPNFQFSVEAIDESNRVIKLWFVPLNRQKTFKLAGGQPVESLTNHMNSLTDEQCETHLGLHKDAEYKALQKAKVASG